MFRMIFGVAGLLLLFQKPAHAYIDPGTASIILQAVVGATAAAGLFFRSHIGRLLSLLRRRAGGESARGGSASGDQEPSNSPDGR